MSNSFNIKGVRDFWDSVADKYESSHLKIENTHFQRFKEAIKYLDMKPQNRVLNVWSRTGEAIPYLKEKCPAIELHNLEVSPEFIAIARRKFPEENIRQTDLLVLDFPNDFFDFALSLETLEHAPEPGRFLKEIHRVLKKGGTLVMSLPPATAELPHRIYDLLANDHGEGPHKFLPSKTVKRLLKEVDFKLISHKGTLLVPVGPVFLQKMGEKVINAFQNTFISEFGIRQFYIACKSDGNAGMTMAQNKILEHRGKA
jgi:ubiquinone/menaquinone biosynthesis C-methylase UbiE